MKKRYLVMSFLLLVVFMFVATPIIGHAADVDKSDFIGNLSCGGTADDGKGITFHKNLPLLTSRIYDILKIGTPVIVIITGMLDILKAVTAQKEDDLKKAQKKFLQRLLAGAIVFLIFVIVEVVTELIADSNEANNAMDCVNCFLNNDCDTESSSGSSSGGETSEERAATAETANQCGRLGYSYAWDSEQGKCVVNNSRVEGSGGQASQSGGSGSAGGGTGGGSR